MLLLLVAACGADQPDVAEPPEAEGDGATTADPEPVTLRFVTGLPEDSLDYLTLWAWIDEVEARAPWITMEYVGGPEAIGTFDQVEALTDGAVDMAATHDPFYGHVFPLAHAMKLSDLSAVEEREAGVTAFLNDAHEREVNAHLLGKPSSATGYMLFLTQPIEQLDLTGLSLRVSPIYESLVEALGGTPVQTPPAEAYTALERGVVQGLGWTSFALHVPSLHEVVSHEIPYRFYQSSTIVLVNLDTWQALDDGTRTVLEETMIEFEATGVEQAGELEEDAERIRREAGIEPLEFTDEERERFFELANDVGWEDAIAADPAAAELRDLLED